MKKEVSVPVPDAGEQMHVRSAVYQLDDQALAGLESPFRLHQKAS